MSELPTSSTVVNEPKLNDGKIAPLFAVRVQSIALATLALIAVFAVLRAGQAVFLPIMLSLLLSFALSPVVSLLQRLRLPRALAAAVVLIALLGMIGLLVNGVRDQFGSLIEQLPVAAQKFARIVRTGHGNSTVQKVQRAATAIENAAAAAAGAPEHASASPPVAPVHWRDYIVAGSIGALGIVSQVVGIIFLLYFFLASGDLYKRKVVKIAGPSLTEKRVTVHILQDVDLQIERFLFIHLVSSIAIAIPTWLTLRFFGIENAGVWGVAAGVLNALPYIGPIAIAVGTALVALLQFDNVTMPLLVAGVMMLLTTLKGLMLMPWLTSRAGRVNAVASFIAIMFWGWIWGIVGLFVAVPITMVIKAVCDRVEHLKPVGELLGT